MSSADVMQGASFYEAICEANINAENWLLTVVDGEHAGEKALVSSGELVWRSDDDGFVTEHEERLKKEVLSGEGRGLARAIRHSGRDGAVRIRDRCAHDVCAS